MTFGSIQNVSMRPYRVSPPTPELVYLVGCLEKTALLDCREPADAFTSGLNLYKDIETRFRREHIGILDSLVSVQSLDIGLEEIVYLHLCLRAFVQELKLE
ncbi:hypothetical protein BGX24_000467 [Mortierella sp. AD032]|nr:hypothetical protein BGX24_000467 [Mortierella sp. AD032]